MRKSWVALLCVVFLMGGLALGFVGRGYMASYAVSREEQQLEKQLTEEEAKIQAMMTGIPVDASKEFIEAKNLVDDMRSLKAALLIFYAKNMEKKVTLENAFGTSEQIRETLGKFVSNIEKYVDGNWIFHGNTGAWWIGYNLEAAFKARGSELGKELMKRAQSYGLCKDMKENLYDGGSTIYMLVRK